MREFNDIDTENGSVDTSRYAKSQGHLKKYGSTGHLKKLKKSVNQILLDVDPIHEETPLQPLEIESLENISL